MTGRTATADPPPAPASAESEKGGRRVDKKLAGGLILLGISVIALLFVSGLVIQPLLPEPYPQIHSQRLPRSIEGAAQVMTVSDRPSDNEPIQWVRGSGHRVSLYDYTPGQPLSNTERLARLAIPEDVSKSSFDVNVWPPWRAEALFSFEQRPRGLAITVSPTWRSDGKAETFISPLSAPPAGTTREFTIAAWGGEKPDLIVITRGDPQSRPVLQILSGESGFKRQTYAGRLPYRGLSPREWAMQIGPIVGLPTKDTQRIFRGIRTDLVMIHHDPSEVHSMVHVLLGETGFEWDAIRRDLDDSGDLPSGTEFLIGSYQGATAVYEIQRTPGGPYLRVFGLNNPPALQ